MESTNSPSHKPSGSLKSPPLNQTSQSQQVHSHSNQFEILQTSQPPP